MKLTWERGLGVRNKCNYPISYHEHRCDGNATVQLTVLGGKHILSLMLTARQKKGGNKFAQGLPTRAETPSMNSTILHGQWKKIISEVEAIAKGTNYREGGPRSPFSSWLHDYEDHKDHMQYATLWTQICGPCWPSLSPKSVHWPGQHNMNPKTYTFQNLQKPHAKKFSIFPKSDILVIIACIKIVLNKSKTQVIF